MIPASFEYEVAESVEQAVELLGSREDAKLLAGGHSLLPAMRLRIARPGTHPAPGLSDPEGFSPGLRRRTPRPRPRGPGR